MVKEVKAGAGKVRRGIDIVFSIVETVALAAAVVKLAVLPYVHTRIGDLPVWQIVAAVLAVMVLCKLWKLHGNES